MKRRFNGRFSDGGSFTKEFANPIEGMANLADVMLVMAVGLMLALVVNWNVDIASKSEEASAAEEVTAIDGLSGEGTPLDDDTQYEELGVVYRDPATGKLYMVENAE
jgi:hypothetical protein